MDIASRLANFWSRKPKEGPDMADNQRPDTTTAELTPNASSPTNPIGPIYPALSTTSDLPQLGGPSPAREGEEANPVEATSEPESVEEVSDKPVETAPKRSRTTKAEREIAALQATVSRLADMMERGAGGVSKVDAAPEPTPRPQRPIKADYDDPEAYEDARMEYMIAMASLEARTHADSQRAASEAKARETAAEAETRRANEAMAAEWNEKRSAAMERYEDYEEVAESPDTPMTIAMLHAIVNSDAGPDIAYWLGQNKKEAGRISKITNPIRQALEIGKIEAALAAKPAAKEADEIKPEPDEPAAEPMVAQVSRAPRPIRPITPRSAPAAPEPAESSADRVERHLAELRKGNMALGWGPPGRA